MCLELAVVKGAREDGMDKFHKYSNNERELTKKIKQVVDVEYALRDSFSV